MRPISNANDEGHNLCLKCGLCCDGTIFTKVQLEAQDGAGKLSLFQINCVEDDFFFPLPCFAHDRIKGCRIYNLRPAKCKNYSCKLLSRFNNQELSFQKAVKLTEHTRQLKKALFKEVKKHDIDKKFLINAWVLVDHIESHLPSRDKKKCYGDVHGRCADFSAYLHKYFIKDRSPD